MLIDFNRNNYNNCNKFNNILKKQESKETNSIAEKTNDVIDKLSETR